MAAQTGPGEHLLGRRTECQALDRLAGDVRAGSSRVLVLRGEAGVGKTALLSHLSAQVTSSQVVQATGVQSEAELAYSGLQQVCAPLLDGLAALPAPQRGALETVFGLSSGQAPDRFLVGLATLTLMAEAAPAQPLFCLVDDVQWLDQASAQILGFVGRRLLAERVALVCVARTGSGDDALVGLPELPVSRLGDKDAGELLLRNVSGPLDPAVGAQIVAESHGNPLALLEFALAWRTDELAGGFGVPGSRPVTGRIEQGHVQRLRQLPADSQLLLLVAAATPVGDAMLLRRAADLLGVDPGAASPAVDAGLLDPRDWVRFAHPLVRSTVYNTASLGERRQVHQALAEVTDLRTDPDRRAWHRARASPGPNEDVAAELAFVAPRAQARAGLAAAAAFGQRAVALTEDPGRRADRALAAAAATLQAGAFETALGLVLTAEASGLDCAQRATALLLRGQVAFARDPGGEASHLLLRAARELEPHDPILARETYLHAWGAATRSDGEQLRQVSRVVLGLPARPGPRRAVDLLLEGLALTVTDGHAAATPVLQQAIAGAAHLPEPDVLRWGWAVVAAAALVWDFDRMRAVSVQQAQLVRDAGALARLPLHLSQSCLTSSWSGDFAEAGALIAQGEEVAAATGSRPAPQSTLRLLSLRGGESETVEAIAAALKRPAGGGQAAASWGHWASAVLYNGLARYGAAAAAAQEAAVNPLDPWTSLWLLPELVEAAVRLREMELAQDALARLTSTTRPAGTEFALGIEARCRALLACHTEAEDLYSEAIDRLGRTPLRPELARAHLLFGEWLRVQGRRGEAGEQLRTAHEMLTAIGMRAFADRAHREMVALGGKVRGREGGAPGELTPQEEQIARLAAAGMSNPEIGAQLFISARTVEWHLRKVFAKLGIRSRRELRRTPSDRLPSMHQ